MDKPDQLGAFDPQDHATLPPACWQAEVERVLITEAQIAERVRALSAELTRDFAGRELVVVAVLNGTVNAIAIDAGNNIIVGGTFTTINLAARTRLARMTSAGGRSSARTSGGSAAEAVRAIFPPNGLFITALPETYWREPVWSGHTRVSSDPFEIGRIP